LQEAFDERKTGWASEYQELKSLLSPEEYNAALQSVLNAHYTSPTVITAMHETLERLGVNGGNILEPSMGVGNFFGLFPESMQNAKLYGVELDSITGRIAKQLYPKANITIGGFENTEFPDDFFDVVIGNVPFGNYKVPDREYNKHNFFVHDYFFAKSINKTRAGGALALITSNGISGGTFDKKDTRIRRYIAERCDLIGAIRLPNNTFKAAAGTDMTTDILFLQKRSVPRDLTTDMPEWVGSSIFHEHEHETENGEKLRNVITLNPYYQENPEMILGKLDIVSGPYGPQLVCAPTDGDLSEKLHLLWDK
jgi:adenine-specific DNA methylase